MEDLGMLTTMLNEALDRCRDAFKARRTAVEVGVDLETQERLVWMKDAKGWNFYLASGRKLRRESIVLSEAPRETRMLAAKAMPELWEKYVRASNLKEAELRKVVEDLDAFATSIEADSEG